MRKQSRRDHAVEEAFYMDAWREEVERRGKGVWYTEGSLMDSNVGAGAVKLQHPPQLVAFAMGEKTTVWDGEMRGIQLALEAEAALEAGSNGTITVAIDRLAAN